MLKEFFALHRHGKARLENSTPERFFALHTVRKQTDRTAILHTFFGFRHSLLGSHQSQKGTKRTCRFPFQFLLF